MPFARPTLSDQRAQAAADLAAALPGADPLLPASNLGVLADISAEGVNALYGYLDWISRQAVPFTAVDEAFEGWAAFKGVTRKAATFATDTATWPGTLGAVLPAGTPVTRGDGWAYVTTADATVGVGLTVTAPIVAVTAGEAGTLQAGSALLLGVAVSGISSTGAAVGTGLPGVDVESFDAFRTRVLQIYANPPQGGSKSDYVEWAEQVAGVTRAWCYPNLRGAGTVVVYAMMDVAEAIHGGFPQGTGGCATLETRDTHATQDLLAIANWIYDLQPVTALVYVLAPSPNTVAFTILLPGASTALKQAISDQIDAVLSAYGSPGGVVNKSRIDSAISALGADTDGFLITAESCDHGSISPTNGNITSSAGYIPRRGVLTWS